MKRIKERIEKDTISLMQCVPYKNDYTKDWRNAFHSGVRYVLNHELFDLEEMWDSLSKLEQEDLVERYNWKYESEDEEGYEDIDEAWNDLSANDQLRFICDKLKEFNTWEIQRVLRDNEWIKELYNETI